ncbi:bifunctional tetrahydrofolate synthase/dihydrofolate synthase [Hydrogenovibrio sp. 3SP14C1]|uniref:bifunctional tetrahydrofolate synthase/dihydrofolate synthase n=1 Tax=Hydrogenovibrio sp. 3SP14C1 TaxID=3038774 RepID=UPI002415A986|nr:bifunctional tetrahydrofolate synthase/dihydrofolate synthase [Hydrogenovibrio sp. 3SP14C1]MDG4813160.1 bifunctional tetrahydrofolate synthase/dihydrofolate synthase [Hydrogenovibrio sp. 3SP14C1]
MKPTETTSLAVWIDWLISLHADEIDLGIDRVKSVAIAMNLIPIKPVVISVAGTNGKGSSVAMLTSIYESAGYQVGAYTSPHLLRFNERIRVQGHLADDKQIVQAFSAIEAARGETKLTYFEFSTLAALWVFAKYSLDVVLLEVGLGGRLDAVNLVDADASLITAIDVDHEDWLGSDRDQIALEKAGVMRAGKPSVCSDDNIPDTLLRYAAEQAVPLKRLSKDFFYQKNNQAWSFLDPQKKSVYPALTLPALSGEFQIQNAAGVVALIESLQSELPVSSEQLSEGLSCVKHSGRLQKTRLGHQDWLVDVAHNPQAASVLADYLKQNSIQADAIFSVLQDKDVLPMIEVVKPYIKKWSIADLAVPRAMSVDQLETVLLQSGVLPENIVKYSDISEAVAFNRQTSEKDVLVWGSFFTVSQTLAYFQND